MLSQYKVMLLQYYDYKIKEENITTTNAKKLYCIACYHTNYDCNYRWWSILSQIILIHRNSMTSIVEVAKL